MACSQRALHECQSLDHAETIPDQAATVLSTRNSFSIALLLPFTGALLHSRRLSKQQDLQDRAVAAAEASSQAAVEAAKAGRKAAALRMKQKLAQTASAQGALSGPEPCSMHCHCCQLKESGAMPLSRHSQRDRKSDAWCCSTLRAMVCHFKSKYAG